MCAEGLVNEYYATIYLGPDSSIFFLFLQHPNNRVVIWAEAPTKSEAGDQIKKKKAKSTVQQS